MTDKRVEAAAKALARNEGLTAEAHGCYYTDLATTALEAADAADDHVRVPRSVLRSWAMVQDRPGMTAEIEKWADES